MYCLCFRLVRVYFCERVLSSYWFVVVLCIFSFVRYKLSLFAYGCSFVGYFIFKLIFSFWFWVCVLMLGGIRKFNKVALLLLSLIMHVFVGVCGVVYLVFPYLNWLLIEEFVWNYFSEIGECLVLFLLFFFYCSLLRQMWYLKGRSVWRYCFSVLVVLLIVTYHCLKSGVFVGVCVLLVRLCCLLSLCLVSWLVYKVSLFVKKWGFVDFFFVCGGFQMAMLAPLCVADEAVSVGRCGSNSPLVQAVEEREEERVFPWEIPHMDNLSSPAVSDSGCLWTRFSELDDDGGRRCEVIGWVAGYNPDGSCKIHKHKVKVGEFVISEDERWKRQSIVDKWRHAFGVQPGSGFEDLYNWRAGRYLAFSHDGERPVDVPLLKGPMVFRSTLPPVDNSGGCCLTSLGKFFCSVSSACSSCCGYLKDLVF